MDKFYKTNPKLLNDFFYYLKFIRGYSEKTITVYNIALIQFCNFIKEYLKIAIDIQDFNIFTFLQVKETDLIAFLTYLVSMDNSPNTRNLKLCAIRRFYKWLLSNNPKIKKGNPALAINPIQRLVRMPKYLNLEQAKKIQGIFNAENSKYPMRNNLIISLFLSTGMRVSELVNTKIMDINFSDKSICIIGKGNKERKVWFNEVCKNKLIQYLKVKNENNKIIDLEQPLFESNLNKKISIRTVEEICKKAYKLMGLEEYGYTTHTLRHTTATLTYMYVSQDILLLKEILGHKSISSTQIYTHVHNKQLKDAVEKNPLNIINLKETSA